MQPASFSHTAADSNSSASAEGWEAATDNPPRRKRRRIATGHGVQLIPPASTVLLPPQQQEQPTLPPIEQRLVAEYQLAANASFAGAEPTETNRPEPAAAFAEALAADEPMEIEAGPAAEEIPFEEIISNFLPSHQKEIRERLNDDGIQQVLNEVKNFLTQLKESGIKLSPGRGRMPTPTLFGCLGRLSVTKDAETIRRFFVKATLFFSAVNTAQTKNTSCLSTMLCSKRHITNFANEAEDNLRLLAGNPCLKQITSMCHRRGVPDPVKAAQIIKWDCWKKDGIFSFELLGAFSAMMSGRGLINDHAQVIEMLAWECLQLDGEFNMELLRSTSSMMHHRGFPDKDTLTAMLAWDCWKIDGKFRIELLRFFSSMMNGRGIPQKEKVEAILAWPCWQVDGKFSFDLLRTFSAMSNSKGLIKRADVERVLVWPCWQVNGKFSLDLLRIFSSMSSGRGLLNDDARINAILAWECWKIEGEFSIELLRAVASMMNGRGLLEKEPTEKLLSSPCWQVDGKFRIELLRTFSSMMRGCGIPQREQVEAILAWPCWQIDGEFSFELLRTFSSMSNGRGLIKQVDVERILAWPCWQVNGKFSIKLLRIFSSMASGRGLLKDDAGIAAILAWECWKTDGEFSMKLLRTVASMLGSRGLPKKEPTENLLSWSCWQVDGKFSFDLLRAFSSMSHSRGLIKQAEVERVLAWPCWQVDGQFSLRLLRVFSSMMSGHGIPEQADVEALLAWPCWQVDGKVSIDRLQLFAATICGRGMPNQAMAEAFLAWLPLHARTSDNGQVYLRSACHAFVRTSIPDPKVLTNIETALCPYFTENITSDAEHSSDRKDEQSEMGQLKALTLFCAASEKWQRNLDEIQQFLAAYNTTSRSRTVVYTIMDSLIQILANHGQAGVRLWLEHHSRQTNSRGRLTAALSISAPLAHIKFALTQLSESEWPEYIELCKNLTLAPNKEQWQALKPLRDLLHKRFTLTLRKRMMLEILWPQSEHSRLRYAEKLDTLLNTVPTISQLYRLHQAFKPQKLQAFLDACLARENTAVQSINETVPEIKTQELLLEGLLLTNHYLSDHGQIPEFCFSKQVAGADGSGVIIDGDAEMPGHQRLWHFIAAMLIELNQTEYQFKQQKLRISPPDSETIVLPKPEFTATNTGFMITNWSLEQLTEFFRATEFTEHWYKKPGETRDICVIRSEQRLQQMRARPENTTQTGDKAEPISAGSLLSPSVIINLIKQGIQLKPAVWSSLKHFAKNGQLSDTLCRLLAPIIEKELASTAPDAIPEIVKKTVAQRLRQTGTSQTAAVATVTQPLSSTSALATPSPYASPIMSAAQMALATEDMDLDMALDATLKVAVEELEHFPVLGSAELDMLEPLRDQMTYSQLMDAMTKINLQSVEQETVLAWQQAFENRRRDPLGLELDELLDSSLEGADD